ncbi:hypothetical protein ACWGJQ_12555 [Peribacillus simplex]
MLRQSRLERVFETPEGKADLGETQQGGPPAESEVPGVNQRLNCKNHKKTVGNSIVFEFAYSMKKALYLGV